MNKQYDREALLALDFRERNLAKKTDSYKVSHWEQFPPGTEYTDYYAEGRIVNKMMRPYGYQMVTKKHLMVVPTRDEVKDANEFWTAHGMRFNLEGWNYISSLGYLPLEVQAVPEGLEVPSQNVLFRVMNTDKRVPWLPGWVEPLLMHSWYPTTVCSISNECKKVILKYLEMTGTPEDIMFKLHDFGFRGATCEEAAEIGGSAHLVNFMGTDTAVGISAAQAFYNTVEMLGFSIPAAEHSTITSWLRENEALAYLNMLEKFATEPNKLVAVVSDSYDLNYAITEIWGKQLKQNVLDTGCTVVVRPDSGNPADMVVRSVKQLDYAYGSDMIKGYKRLNPAVRVIQGDGMAGADEVEAVYKALADAGYSADNLAVGMGAGLLQKCDRDTYKFAMKMSAAQVNGEWRDVYKDPIDAPWKKSKKGRLTLVKDENDQFKTVTIQEAESNGYVPQLRTIFKDGELLVDETFETIRNR